jgi:hypothetical protein
MQYVNDFILTYNIPFVSFANTLKVTYLLTDIGLLDCLFDDMNMHYNNISPKLKQINKSQLKQIYKNISAKVNCFYNNLSHIDLDDIVTEYDKYKIKSYINLESIEQYCSKLYDNICANNDNLSIDSKQQIYV